MNGPPLPFLCRTTSQLLDYSLHMAKGNFWAPKFAVRRQELSRELLPERTMPNPQQGGACRAGGGFLAGLVAFLGTSQVTPCA